MAASEILHNNHSTYVLFNVVGSGTDEGGIKISHSTVPTSDRKRKVFSFEVRAVIYFSEIKVKYGKIE